MDGGRLTLLRVFFVYMPEITRSIWVSVSVPLCTVKVICGNKADMFFSSLLLLLIGGMSSSEAVAVV